MWAIEVLSLMRFQCPAYDKFADVKVEELSDDSVVPIGSSSVSQIQMSVENIADWFQVKFPDTASLFVAHTTDSVRRVCVAVLENLVCKRNVVTVEGGPRPDLSRRHACLARRHGGRQGGRQTGRQRGRQAGRQAEGQQAGQRRDFV